MRLITFLGTGGYSETTYVWVDERGVEGEHTSRFAPVASAYLLGADAIVLLATPEAQAMHSEPLRQALADVAPLEWIEIPGGRDEAEMWQVFDALAGCVAPGETIALDVTHGFRSLPMVAIMAAGFLRTARRVNVAHILYGAWEARDTQTTPPRTPLFDLTPMFALTEWAVAADRFVRHGDARDLAELLSSGNPPYAQRRDDPALEALSRSTSRLANGLDRVSEDLLLIRPHRAMVDAHALVPSLERAEMFAPANRPFAELLDQVAEALSWLALPDPTDPEHLVQNLARQQSLIRWYAERGHYVHAIALAREWVVSWWMVCAGEKDLLDRDARVKAEDLLGKLHDDAKKGRATGRGLALVPSDINLGQLWGQLTSIRNDLAHVVDDPTGKGRGGARPDTLIKNIKDVIAEIEQLALPDQD